MERVLGGSRRVSEADPRAADPQAADLLYLAVVLARALLAAFVEELVPAAEHLALAPRQAASIAR